MEDRKAILASYYGVGLDIINMLAAIPYGNERKALCKSFRVDPYIFRTMIDYTRYLEATKLHEALKRVSVDLTRLALTDFGCLVSDYGIYFARLGTKVHAYDTADVVKFVSYRFELEHLYLHTSSIPTDYNILTKSADLLIFGEVLEHLSDPLSVLQACVDNRVKYIFTSCYPFGNDQYFNLPGHSKIAQSQQSDCANLLKQSYTGAVIHKKACFWMRTMP